MNAEANTEQLRAFSVDSFFSTDCTKCLKILFEVFFFFFFKVLSRQVMCEGAKQQETLLTYDRERWEFPEGFWEPGSS